MREMKPLSIRYRQPKWEKMRRIPRLCALICFITLCLGCTHPGTSSYMLRQNAPPPEAPAPGKALIYFMRPSGYGYGIHFPIYHESELIGLSQAMSYFTYECKPGKQRFIGTAENKSGLKAELAPDKTYLVLTKAHTGKTKARIEIIPVIAGSPLWQKFEGYKETLVHTIPDTRALNEWMTTRQGQADGQLNKIYTFLDTAEGERYVVKLVPGDGR